MDKAIDQLVEKAQSDERVLGVILYGSRAQGEEHSQSDIDVCLVLQPGKDTKAERVNVRLAYLLESGFDIQIFQSLPLYIRSRVLREGKVLYCQKLDQLYELAYRTVKAYERFKPRYRYYLEQVANA